MASSAFKSTTKRTPIGTSVASADDTSSTNRSSVHRRSRSLSRFSHRMPSSPVDKAFGEAQAPRGRFVTTHRGSGFPEISLDDLSVEFFGSGDRGRSGVRNSEQSAMDISAASHRRGRSVSRHNASKISASGSDGKGRPNFSAGGGKVVSENNLRRRRSVSVVRYQISDSESDLDQSQNSGPRVKDKSFGMVNKQKPIPHKADDSNRKPILRRSLSQKDFKCHDGYSSQSSVLTDDEMKDVYFNSNGIEKTTRTIYAKKAEKPIGNVINSGLYEAMREELRHAVEVMRVELEQEMVNKNSPFAAISDDLHSNNSDALQLASPYRRGHSVKAKQSEKHKDVLAKMVLEEQYSRELSKLMENLSSDQEDIVVENSTRSRKRSNDRSKMSKRLNEEAERYIEDFISNVEDTDISSIDGDRSDTSSSLGGTMKPDSRIPAMSRYAPFPPNPSGNGMDGVVLPWLQWETSNDASPYLWKNRVEPQPPMTPKTIPWDISQGESNAHDKSNNQSGSSQGSWSPGVTIVEDIGSRFKKPNNYENESQPLRGSGLDLEEYLNRPTNEDFLLEKWKQKHKINSGSLLLCNHIFL